MKFNKKQLFGLILGSLTILQVNAASITLKDGRSFEGEIKSHNSETVVLDMKGLEMILPSKDISSIDLTQSSTPIEAQQSSGDTQSETVPETESDSGTIVAGSTIMVKISEGFNTRHHKTGQRFSGVLESNLMSGNTVIAPKGSTVYGVLTNVKKAGRVAGSASLSFELTELSIAGTMHAIKTQTLSGEGDNTAKSSAGKTARAAAIGGLVNGSSGAKNGAKVGVGASLLSQGSDIEVPSNALLDFTLNAPFTLS